MANIYPIQVTIEEEEAQKMRDRYANKRSSSYQSALIRHNARIAAKKASRLDFAIQEVKEYARKDTWATSHANCFRCSPSIEGKGESDSHLFRKFQLYLEYRKLGYAVFTETILEYNGSTIRPDLIVCGNNGETEIIEIAESESEASLKKKADKYPFPERIVRCDALKVVSE